jgi:hypothetical protein
MFGSGSTNGNMVALAATSTALHTAVAGTNHIDEVYVYACNIHTADVQVTLEIDGTAAANQMIETIPYKDGYHLILPGIRMENAGTIQAKAGTADVINCIVIVNRYIDPETAS